MKRTIAQSEFKRATEDMSYRTLHEIRGVAHKRKLVIHHDREPIIPIGIMSSLELEKAKKLAAKYLKK